MCTLGARAGVSWTDDTSKLEGERAAVRFPVRVEGQAMFGSSLSGLGPSEPVEMIRDTTPRGDTTTLVLATPAWTSPAKDCVHQLFSRPYRPVAGVNDAPWGDSRHTCVHEFILLVSITWASPV